MVETRHNATVNALRSLRFEGKTEQDGVTIRIASGDVTGTVLVSANEWDLNVHENFTMRAVLGKSKEQICAEL